MNPWLLVLLNMSIGSVIGGVTNELAIRMLFRPYQPWRIGGIRVPFTPGLIPRRRDEIAGQMGRLVEEHLLTTEGIKRALAQGDLEHTLRRWLTGYAQEWMSDERTLRHLLSQMAPQLFADDGTWSDAVREPMKRHWRSFAGRLISQYEEKRLREVIPAAGLDKLEAMLAAFSRQLVDRLRQYLHSAEGQQTIQNMLRGLLGGGGGMFSGLVGMFLSDDKVIGKLLPYVDELLQNPELSSKLQHVLQQEADRLLDKQVKEVMAWIGEGQLEEWSMVLFDKLEEQTLAVVDMPLARLLGGFRQTIEHDLIPRLAEWAVHTLKQNVERVFRNLSIKEIVARQVESFPIERIEEMIVGISGREFRMITVLGFVLGGVIGLVQGLLSLWFSK
jgi:uncharacterized membrane protein YheB (UPF0754 family)